MDTASSCSIELNGKVDAMLKLNVGGCNFFIREKTIRRRLPNSRLAEFVDADRAERLNLCDGIFNDEENKVRGKICLR